MSRKNAIITVLAEGRDKGKVYHLTEMPATAGERWATRALILMVNAGVKLPDGVGNAGMAGVAIAGFDQLQRINSEEVLNLLDELMTCVKIEPAPKENPGFIRDLVENDIEEVATRLYLKSEVFFLHTGFSWADVKSMLTSKTSANSSITQMSPAPSGQ